MRFCIVILLLMLVILPLDDCVRNFLCEHSSFHDISTHFQTLFTSGRRVPRDDSGVYLESDDDDSSVYIKFLSNVSVNRFSVARMHQNKSQAPKALRLIQVPAHNPYFITNQMLFVPASNFVFSQYRPFVWIFFYK